MVFIFKLPQAAGFVLRADGDCGIEFSVPQPALRRGDARAERGGRIHARETPALETDTKLCHPCDERAGRDPGEPRQDHSRFAATMGWSSPAGHFLAWWCIEQQIGLVAHPAGEAAAKRSRRKLPRTVAGRVPEHELVREFLISEMCGGRSEDRKIGRSPRGGKNTTRSGRSALRYRTPMEFAWQLTASSGSVPLSRHAGLRRTT
jgi:hypothetical protein